MPKKKKRKKLPLRRRASQRLIRDVASTRLGSAKFTQASFKESERFNMGTLFAGLPNNTRTPAQRRQQEVERIAARYPDLDILGEETRRQSRPPYAEFYASRTQLPLGAFRLDEDENEQPPEAEEERLPQAEFAGTDIAVMAEERIRPTIVPRPDDPQRLPDEQSSLPSAATGESVFFRRDDTRRSDDTYYTIRSVAEEDEEDPTEYPPSSVSPDIPDSISSPSVGERSSGGSVSVPDSLLSAATQNRPYLLSDTDLEGLSGSIYSDIVSLSSGTTATQPEAAPEQEVAEVRYSRTDLSPLGSVALQEFARQRGIDVPAGSYRQGTSNRRMLLATLFQGIGQGGTII